MLFRVLFFQFGAFHSATVAGLPVFFAVLSVVLFFLTKSESSSFLPLIIGAICLGFLSLVLHIDLYFKVQSSQNESAVHNAVPDLLYWAVLILTLIVTILLPILPNFDWSELSLLVVWIGLCLVSFALFSPFCVLIGVLWYLGEQSIHHRRPSEDRSTNVTSDSHPYEVDSMTINDTMCISMSICPGRKKGNFNRDLRADIQRLKDHFQVTHVVSLVTLEELTLLDCLDIHTESVNQGIEHTHYDGFRDKFLPPSEVSFRALVNQLTRQIHTIAESEQASRMHLFVHCNGGKGRTGTLVACLLAELMDQDNQQISLSDLVSPMREARPGMLQNPLQQMFVRYYLAW